MIHIFKLEVGRIFKSKKSLFFFFGFIIVSLYLVNIGIVEYSQFINKKNVFMEYEQSKIKRYLTYEQYCWYGYRTIYEPSPLMVFFNDSRKIKDIESTINTLENNTIYSISEGRALFQRNHQIDFSGLFFIFGSLFMIYMGLNNFRSDKLINFAFSRKYALSSIFSRLILLNLTFAVIFLIDYFFSILRGVDISRVETGHFFVFCLDTLALLTFFYVLGLFVSIFFRSRRLVIILALWFIFIFIVPELHDIYLSNESKNIATKESLNYEKFNTLMDMENKANEKILPLTRKNEDPEKIYEMMKEFALQYISDGFRKNQESEETYHQQIARIVKINENHSLLFPVLYSKYLAGEISGNGYDGAMQFSQYLMKNRERFLKFYIDKVYISRDKIVESFVKADENVFRAESRIPGSYWTGLGLTIMYAFLLLMISFWVMTRRLKKTPVIEEKPELEFKEGTSHFLFCKDAQYRDNLFRIYENKEGVLGIDRVTAADVNTEILPQKSVRYISAVRGVNEDEVLKNLSALGVEEADLKIRTSSPELLKKIYAAILLAAPQRTIVINDFLKGETREFEKLFLELVVELKRSGRMVVYMSDSKFSFTAHLEEVAFQVDTYHYTEFDIGKVSLR